MRKIDSVTLDAQGTIVDGPDLLPIEEEEKELTQEQIETKKREMAYMGQFLTTDLGYTEEDLERIRQEDEEQRAAEARKRVSKNVQLKANQMAKNIADIQRKLQKLDTVEELPGENVAPI